MIILVSGGAGFIGSHLCEVLLGRGDTVLVVDNLSTGTYTNIKHLIAHPNFKFFYGSIEDKRFIEPIVQQSDIIYHLAAAVGVRKIIESPVNTLEMNVIGTHNILNMAARYNKKILLTSTSEVYGKLNKFPFKEDDDCLLGSTSKSRWSYACSKMLDEFLALAYYKERGLPVIIVRLFNTVGPRQTGRYGMVIPSFIKQALAEKDITVFGDGHQSRCFIHVSEAVEAIIKLMDCPKAIGELINIGSNQEITINDLAIKIKEITGTKSNISFIPYDEAYEIGFEDMERRIPAIEKARELIGFNPVKSIDFIIEDIISHEIEKEIR